MSPEIVPKYEMEARSLGAGMVLVGSESEGFKVLRKPGERTIPVKGATILEALFNASMGLMYERDWDQLFQRPRHESVVREPKAGFVYFIGGEVGAVKIGFAVKPELRVRDLQCGSPIPLSILAVASGYPKDERDYHRRFAEYRMHGEWFERCPAIEAEIERLSPTRGI